MYGSEVQIADNDDSQFYDRFVSEIRSMVDEAEGYLEEQDVSEQFQLSINWHEFMWFWLSKTVTNIERALEKYYDD